MRRFIFWQIAASSAHSHVRENVFHVAMASALIVTLGTG